jgi:hypothetical protein
MCGQPRRAAEDDPLLGKVIADRYLLRQRLGQGGSGTIYLAEHITVKRKVAVKVLHHELSQDDLAIERFRREATTVAEIDNEHIVEVLDFGRLDDGRLFLAMELLDGETLAAAIRRQGKLSVEQALDVLVQVGEALMEAHAMGYVHRDLRRQHLPRPASRPAGVRQDPRLRPRQAGRARGGGGDHQPGHDLRRPLLHVARAGARRGRRPARRHLRPRLHGLRDAHRPAALRRQEGLRGAQPAPRGPAAAPVTAAPRPRPWLDALILRALAKRAEDRFVTVYRLIEAVREGQSTGQTMSDEAPCRCRRSSPSPRHRAGATPTCWPRRRWRPRCARRRRFARRPRCARRRRSRR